MSNFSFNLVQFHIDQFPPVVMETQLQNEWERQVYRGSEEHFAVVLVGHDVASNRNSKTAAG
jgi:hypothetical protein